MDFVINDIPFEYEVKNNFDAREILERFYSIVVTLESNIKNVQLLCDESIDTSELIHGEIIVKTINNSSLRRDKIRVLMRVLSQKKIVKYHRVFLFNGNKSDVCAYASENKTLVISLLTNGVFDYPFLKGIIGEREATVLNISQPIHIEDHSDLLKIRIYEFNPKHKIGYGWGSPMDLDDETAQLLLNDAIQYDNDEKCLVNKYNGQFYVFRRHFSNCYHGYRHDSLPVKIKKKFD